MLILVFSIAHFHLICSYLFILMSKIIFFFLAVLFNRMCVFLMWVYWSHLSFFRFVSKTFNSYMSLNIDWNSIITIKGQFIDLLSSFHVQDCCINKLRFFFVNVFFSFLSFWVSHHLQLLIYLWCLWTKQESLERNPSKRMEIYSFLLNVNEYFSGISSFFYTKNIFSMHNIFFGGRSKKEDFLQF